MHKFLIVLLTFPILINASGQGPVDLTLKFNGISPTIYKVTMSPENIDSVKIGVPFLSSDSSSDDFLKNMKKNSNDFFLNDLREEAKKDHYFIIKRMNKNKFLILYTDEHPNDMFSSNYKAYMDNKGRNLSFYLADGVDIMIRTFFGLPDRKVKLGDRWQLGIDLTAFSGGIIKCDSSYKKDSVEVIDISMQNDDTLVTIRYDFQEYFQGLFYIPTTSSVKYYGNAIFSVNRGIWISYNCFKETEMTGFANSKSKEIYKLELTTRYPKKILAQFDE